MKSYTMILLAISVLCFDSILCAQQSSAHKIETGLRIENVVDIKFEGAQTDDLWLIEGLGYSPQINYINIIVTSNITLHSMLVESVDGSGNLSNASEELRTKYSLAKREENIMSTPQKEDFDWKDGTELKELTQTVEARGIHIWTFLILLSPDSSNFPGVYINDLNVRVEDKLGNNYTKTITVQANLNKN